MKNRAIFFDKDGTLVYDVPYNVDPEKVYLVEGAGELLRTLQRAGYKLFIVSNQSGVARGYFAERELKGIWKKLTTLLRPYKVRFQGFYYCPHAPQDTKVVCQCRKPGSGMLVQAASEHDIDLFSSWMVGDILHDVEAGNRVGCRTVLLDVGHETEWRAGPYRLPTAVAHSLAEVGSRIFEIDTLMKTYGHPTNYQLVR